MTASQCAGDGQTMKRLEGEMGRSRMGVGIAGVKKCAVIKENTVLMLEEREREKYF